VSRTDRSGRLADILHDGSERQLCRHHLGGADRCEGAYVGQENGARATPMPALAMIGRPCFSMIVFK
jgi:hypothetical protein